MARPAPLPLAVEELPPSIRKFCDPQAPAAARTMAARGMVPIKGPEQVMLLLQLSADGDAAVAKSAAQTLDKFPDATLHTAAEAELPPSFLDRLAEHFREREDVLERLAANVAVESGTLEWIALRGSERVSERIAVNEQRLLGAPRVIEALYKNKNTRMSTADRLIELAARNGVVLDLPTFEAHVAAIKGQLIPEATEEPLPSDLDFKAALSEDLDDPEVVSPPADDAAEEEQVKEQFLPLMMRIRNMTSAEKLRLATVGNAAARAFLVRDKNRTVAYSAITSPAMQEPEVMPIVRSKEVAEEILRYIGNKRDWTRSHEVKHGLVFNPKTPVGIALRFVGHLRDDELKTLSRSRNVAQPLKSAALQRIAQKEKKDRGG
jgi:hypothetical protein